MPNEQITKVVFRRWKTDGQQLLALFPEEPADYSGFYCDSYGFGGHGAADYLGCVGATTPVEPSECAPIKKQLERIGYKLKVVRRRSRSMQETFEEKMNALRTK